MKNDITIAAACFGVTVVMLVLVFLLVFTIKYAWSLA